MPQDNQKKKEETYVQRIRSKGSKFYSFKYIVYTEKNVCNFTWKLHVHG